MDTVKMLAVLEEMRDVHRAHLEEYRRIANESLALQRQAFELQQSAVAQQKISVDAQSKYLRLYRFVVAGAGLLIILAVWLFAKYL